MQTLEKNDLRQEKVLLITEKVLEYLFFKKDFLINNKEQLKKIVFDSCSKYLEQSVLKEDEIISAILSDLEPIFEYADSEYFSEILINTHEAINGLLQNPEGYQEKGKTLYSLVDLFSSPTLNLEDWYLAIKNNLGLSLFDENGEEKLEDFEKLNLYFAEAVDILLNDLYFEDYFPKSLKNYKIVNKETLDYLIKKTFKNNPENKILGPSVCAIFKIILAVNEVYKESLDNLEEKKEKILVEINNNFNENELKKDHRFFARAKSIKRMILKMLRKPDTDINKIIKDGIGCRFEAGNKEEIEKFIDRIIDFLTNQEIETKNLSIKNLSLFSDFDFNELKEKYDKNKISFLENNNIYTNKMYKAIHMLGKIKIPGEKKFQNIEFQFAYLNGEEQESNQLKFAHHSIYEAKQILSVITRLYGYFPEKYLNKISEMASKNYNEVRENTKPLYSKEVKEHLIKNILVKVGSSDLTLRKNRYATIDHIFRLKDIFLMPNSIKVKIDEQKEIISEIAKKLRLINI
jgi:hypothetical protein